MKNASQKRLVAPKSAITTTKNTDKKSRKIQHSDSKEPIKQEENKEEIPLFGYDGIFSVFSLTEQKPAKLKAELEKILTSEKTSEKDFMRLSFLYFFELMGVPRTNDEGF
jgi:hypothetical protein